MRGSVRGVLFVALVLALTVPEALAYRVAPPRARVRLGTANVGRGLPAYVVRRYMTGARGRLRACYNRREATAPRAGRIRTTFSIGPSGRVILVAASGFSAGVAKCVRGVVAALKFPRRKGRVTVPVYYPMRFSPPAPPRIIGHGGVRLPKGKIGTGRIGGRLLTPVPRRRDMRLRFVWSSYRVMGDLDKNIIRRYLYRNRRRMRNCLDRHLLLKPKVPLRGILRAHYVILPTGKVAGARVAGVDATVARCVASVLSRVLYPKPKGGGIVKVQLNMRVRMGNPRTASRFPRGMRGVAVKIDRPIGGGAVSVQDTVVRHARRLYGCYKRRLRKRPGLRGRVMVRFALPSSGRPIKLSAWGMGSVAGCIAYVMRQIRFPGGAVPPVNVTYRFTFAPK